MTNSTFLHAVWFRPCHGCPVCLGIAMSMEDLARGLSW
jgi:hypothetical protein